MTSSHSEGPDSPLKLKPGDKVVPLASLTCIPLALHAVLGFYGEAVAVVGTAVLFASSPVAVVPADITPAVAVLSLDISSLVPQVQRAFASMTAELPAPRVRGTTALLPPRSGSAPAANFLETLQNDAVQVRQRRQRPLNVYVQGIGKSGLAAMATIRQMEARGYANQIGAHGGSPASAPESSSAAAAAAAAASASAAASRPHNPQYPYGVRIVASDYDSTAVASSVVKEYADDTFQVDSRDPLRTLEHLERLGMPNGADLVLACHNARGCEGAAVMATAAYGKCIFFSMATSFSQANLATDIAGKDVTCMFGVGLAHQQDARVFDLLRSEPPLHAHFKAMAAHLDFVLGSDHDGGSDGSGGAGGNRAAKL